MGGRGRLALIVVLVAALGALPTMSFADTYPPPVEATEVVDRDATPRPVTGVAPDQVVVPAPVSDVLPTTDALTTTGVGVLPMLLVALVLLVVGGVMATLTQRRRDSTVD